MRNIQEIDPSIYATDHNYARLFTNSANVLRIGELKPSFLTNSNTSLCDSTPQNIIGNLLLTDLLPQISDIYSQHQNDLPQALRIPEEMHGTVYTNLRCLIKPSKTHLIELNYLAPSVYIKHTIGQVSGMILTGELTGTIVTIPYGDPHHPEYVLLKRVFNDSVLDRKNIVYPYAFTDDTYSAFWKPSKADKKAVLFYKKRYRNFINRLPKHVRTMRQAVFYALQRHNISTDEDQCSFTLSQKDYALLTTMQ